MFIPTAAQPGPTTPLLQQQAAAAAAQSVAVSSATAAAAAQQQSAATQLQLQTAAAQAAASAASAAAVRDMAQSPVGCSGSQIQSKQTPSNPGWRFASSTPAGTGGTPAGTPTATPHPLSQTISMPAQDCLDISPIPDNNNNSTMMTPVTQHMTSSNGSTTNSASNKDKPTPSTTTNSEEASGNKQMPTIFQAATNPRKLGQSPGNIFQFPPVIQSYLQQPPAAANHQLYKNQHLDSGATVQYVSAARGGNIALMPPTGNQQQVTGNKVDVAPGNPEVALSTQQPSIVFDHIQQQEKLANQQQHNVVQKQQTAVQQQQSGVPQQQSAVPQQQQPAVSQQQQSAVQQQQSAVPQQQSVVHLPQQHPQLYQQQFQEEAFPGQMFVPYSQPQFVPVFKPGVHFGNQLLPNFQVHQQGGHTYYQQLPVNNYGGYMAPAGSGSYSQQQLPQTAAAATAVVNQSAPVNVPLATQVSQGIDGSYGDVVGLQGPGQVYLQDCYPSPQYYHPLQGYLVPAQPGFLPAATMMQPPTAVSSSATSSGQQHQPPTSSQGHLKEKDVSSNANIWDNSAAGGKDYPVWQPQWAATKDNSKSVTAADKDLSKSSTDDVNSGRTGKCDVLQLPNFSSSYYPPPLYSYSAQSSVCQQHMAPLTPITPSVDPSQGSKTGFTVPHTPNTMTNSQFQFNCVQSPVHSDGKSRPNSNLSSYDYSQARGAGKGVSGPTGGGDLVAVGWDRSHLNSPYKQFVKFTGQPHRNKFPLAQMPRLSKRNIIFPLNQVPPRHQAAGRRPFGAGPAAYPRGGSVGSTSPHSGYQGYGNQQNKFRLRRPSDSKCQFYKKGDGFGKRNELPAANSTPSKAPHTTEGKSNSTPTVFKEKNSFSPILKEATAPAKVALLKTGRVKSDDLPQTPPLTPAVKQAQTPPLMTGPAVKLAEPDLLQGKMKKLQLNED